MPDTRPETPFKNGVCPACRYLSTKKVVDWDVQAKKFSELAEQQTSPTGYDCVIPVSGGKDSTYQVLMALEYGFKPLCVCFETILPTDEGDENLTALRELGVDLIHIKPNPDATKELTRFTFEKLGVAQWALFLGAYVLPTRIALQMSIPLILWGENRYAEYGGTEEQISYSGVDVYGVEKGGGGLLGLTLDGLIEAGFSEKDLALYRWPSEAEIAAVGLSAVYVGDYFEWDQREIVQKLAKHGWFPKAVPTGSSYTGYNGIDCDALEVNDYLKYVKFGYGRATDEACLDIRYGRITRDEGLRLVARYDGRLPHKAMERFANYLDMDMDQLIATIDRFTNRELFEFGDAEKPLRDVDNILIRKK